MISLASFLKDELSVLRDKSSVLSDESSVLRDESSLRNYLCFTVSCGKVVANIGNFFPFYIHDVTRLTLKCL